MKVQINAQIKADMTNKIENQVVIHLQNHQKGQINNRNQFMSQFCNKENFVKAKKGWFDIFYAIPIICLYLNLNYEVVQREIFTAAALRRNKEANGAICY